MTAVLIVTHNEFGAYLLEACEHIVGTREFISSISITPRMSVQDVSVIVEKKSRELMSSTDSIVYFVDLPGGTPMNVILPYAKKIEKSAVICGVNMTMLITAMNNKDKMEFKELVEKIIASGKKSICDVKSILK
jgi:mannose/fructose-specific phosphotransferase system component IIA